MSKIRSLYYSLLEIFMIFFVVINIIAYLQTHNDVLEEIFTLVRIYSSLKFNTYNI